MSSEVRTPSGSADPWDALVEAAKAVLRADFLRQSQGMIRATEPKPRRGKATQRAASPTAPDLKGVPSDESDP